MGGNIEELYSTDDWLNLESAVSNGIGRDIKIRLPEPTDSYSPFGYVDHQSIGLIMEEVSIEIASLSDIIFSNNFEIIIDNDNY